MIPLGQGTSGPAYLDPAYANRHGLIAGATGSGKTVSLETLALGFAAIGTPSFVCDVKGDIAGALKRSSAPVHIIEPNTSLRISVSRVGPDLLSRVLELSEVQSGVLEIVCAYAESKRLKMSTLRDFRRVLSEVFARRASISGEFGLVGAASIAAIQRALLCVEREGGSELLGDPTFDVATLDKLAAPGTIHVLDAVRLMRSPRLYGAVLLFIMQDLYDRLPEVGDLDAPRLALFLDEAHLLFQDATPAVLQKIERIVRLIRSKGVGLFFVTQSPADIPPVILGQLGNRIQHGLRGATPADMRSIRAAADTLPSRPGFDAAGAIGRLGVGQALVSTVGAHGIPGPVDMVRIKAPELRAVEVPVIERSVEPSKITRKFWWTSCKNRT